MRLRHSLARVTLAAALAVTAIPTIAHAQNVVRTADPIKRGMKESDVPRTVKVAENVYTYEDYHSGPEKFTTTNLFVVTPEGVFLCDAQGSVDMTAGLVKAIATVTDKPIKYVVIASEHGDHTAGNSALPAGVKYIIHPTSKAILDKAAAANDKAWTLPADADVVSDKKAYTLGGQQFVVTFLGRAHTGGDLAVWLPDRKILFLSEIYLNRVFPAMRSAYPTEWLGALKKAQDMKADIYVAGHGFTETGPVSKEEIVNYDKAMRAVIAEVTRLHKMGLSVDDAVKQANWGEYGDWTLAKSQGPIAIRKVYEELNGQLK